MRTENDLRLALLQRAEQAPEVSWALIERALADSSPQSRTRARLSIAVAVAVAAALIAVPLGIKRTMGNSTAPHPSPAATSTTVKKVLALSWIELPDGNWSDRLLYGTPNQENIFTSVFPPAKGNSIVITDFPPGGFDTSQLAAAKPVTVDGHRGYYGQITTMTGPRPTVGLRYHPVVGPHKAVAWEIAPDQWVVLSEGYEGYQATTESQLVAIASNLGIRARSTPARMPFKVGYLPGAGWQLHTLDLGNPRSSAVVGILRLTRANTELVITVSSAPTSIAGVKGALLGHLGRFYVSILERLPGTDTPSTEFDSATLARIVHSVVVASPSDQEGSSWFPVNQLLP
ncbi:MAG: hypothetical protein ABI418_21490 [Jatrophihabitantaceae bacterium]